VPAKIHGLSLETGAGIDSPHLMRAGPKIKARSLDGH
jgi:hypothetical protein